MSVLQAGIDLCRCHEGVNTKPGWVGKRRRLQLGLEPNKLSAQIWKNRVRVVWIYFIFVNPDNDWVRVHVCHELDGDVLESLSVMGEVVRTWEAAESTHTNSSRGSTGARSAFSLRRLKQWKADFHTDLHNEPRIKTRLVGEMV